MTSLWYSNAPTFATITKNNDNDNDTYTLTYINKSKLKLEVGDCISFIERSFQKNNTNFGFRKNVIISRFIKKKNNKNFDIIYNVEENQKFGFNNQLEYENTTEKFIQPNDVNTIIKLPTGCLTGGKRKTTKRTYKNKKSKKVKSRKMRK